MIKIGFLRPDFLSASASSSEATHNQSAPCLVRISETPRMPCPYAFAFTTGASITSWPTTLRKTLKFAARAFFDTSIQESTFINTNFTNNYLANHFGTRRRLPAELCQPL